MNTPKSKGTVVLIHGAWLNAQSWERIKARYEARGFTVLAPDWPFDDRRPEELRQSPASELAKLSQREIVNHYDRIIRALPEPPILIGHSLGAVFVQHLLDRGLGAAGVAIDPAPTPGVPIHLHALVSALPIFLDPFSRSKIKSMSRRFFRRRFAQTAATVDTDALYDRYIVPTPGRVYWDGIIHPMKIDWANPRRAPLLLIGGGRDLIADASMTRAIYRKQRRSPSKTEYLEYPTRSHWTLLDEGWEEVADVAMAWALSV
ncbi:alpha/beta hydrolase [Novosphingobium profundi]|uniref:alpha/beta hydrolase n=1 Tax=Novosphingobium profundi TaxID=1774954 RepID=UPI001BD99730|nr:alpha/beta hydrolase [Novosphingobium profundi]MBT0670652.1 alpha/beta hydrolase [Novosphingobium profundi]